MTGYNKGGLLVNVEGVHAFVPLSQVVGVRPDAEGEGGLASAVGKQLRLKVIEINRRRNRVILSERAALQEWRSQQKDRLLAELKEGEIRKGRVSSVRSFGVFIDLGGADGLAHLSEVSWDRNKSPEEMYHVGDEVDVYVMKVDPETKKIALSLRRAQPEEWDLIVDKYQVGRVVPGMVTKLVTFGAFARIEGPVEGLIHVSELVDRRIAHPKEVVREGDLLPLKIVRIERDRHRLGLSLREARDEGEQHGLRASATPARCIGVPEDIRKEFEEREGVTVVERGPDERAATPLADDAAVTSRRRGAGSRARARAPAPRPSRGASRRRRWRRRSPQPRPRATRPPRRRRTPAEASAEATRPTERQRGSRAGSQSEDADATRRRRASTESTDRTESRRHSDRVDDRIAQNREGPGRQDATRAEDQGDRGSSARASAPDASSQRTRVTYSQRVRTGLRSLRCATLVMQS